MLGKHMWGTEVDTAALTRRDVCRKVVHLAEGKTTVCQIFCCALIAHAPNLSPRAATHTALGGQ